MKKTSILLAIILLCGFIPTQQVAPYVYVEGSGGDDTQALQAAFDYLNERYGYTGQNALVVLKGTFRISDTLDLRDKYRVSVVGLDAEITSAMPQAAIDAHGSTYLTMQGVHIKSPLAFVYGRNAAKSGGGLHLEDMMIHGDVELGGADTSVFERVTVHGKTTITQGVTAKGISFRDSWLEDVDIIGGVVNLKFDGCYFTGTVTIDGAYDVAFINSQWEIADPPLYIKGVGGFKLDGIDFSVTAPYLIVMDVPGATSGWDIGITSRSNTSAKLIHIVRGTLTSSALTVSSVDILNEAGTVVKNNKITVNGTQPFAGTGTVKNNRIESGYYNTIQTAGLKLDSSTCTGDFCYANTAIIKMANTQPTTLLRLAPNVTVVYLVFDGKTTIGGGGWYFPDYQVPITPAAGTVMQFINLNGWYWKKVE